MLSQMVKDAEYVIYSICVFVCHIFRLKQPTANQVLQMKQVYGVLDVQRVAGNFHISVHGLNFFVAQQVSYLKS